MKNLLKILRFIDNEGCVKVRFMVHCIVVHGCVVTLGPQFHTCWPRE